MRIEATEGRAQKIIMTSSHETTDIGFWDRLWPAMGKSLDSPEVTELVRYAEATGDQWEEPSAVGRGES